MKFSLSVFKRDTVDIDIELNEIVETKWSNFVYMRISKYGFSIIHDRDEKIKIIGVDMI